MSRLLLPALGCVAGATPWHEPQRGCPCCAVVVPLSLTSDGEGQKTGEKHTLNHQLWPVNVQHDAGVPLMGTCGALLAANVRRCGRISCLHRCDRRKKWHEGGTLTTQRLTKCWNLRNAVCFSNEQNHHCGVFIKFVFNKNLCSDETGTPTCCFAGVLATASKACIFCQMHRT